MSVSLLKETTANESCKQNSDQSQRRGLASKYNLKDLYWRKSILLKYSP